MEKTSSATSEKTWEPTADAEATIILAMGTWQVRNLPSEKKTIQARENGRCTLLCVLVCMERAQVQGVGGWPERARVNMEMINLDLKLKLECCLVPLFWKRDYVTQTGAGVRIWQAAAVRQK